MSQGFSRLGAVRQVSFSNYIGKHAKSRDVTENINSIDLSSLRTVKIIKPNNTNNSDSSFDEVFEKNDEENKNPNIENNNEKFIYVKAKRQIIKELVEDEEPGKLTPNRQLETEQTRKYSETSTVAAVVPLSESQNHTRDELTKDETIKLVVKAEEALLRARTTVDYSLKHAPKRFTTKCIIKRYTTFFKPTYILYTIAGKVEV